MKKILLLSLLLNSIIFCDSANMKANAEILETLTIRVDKDVEFGKLAKGSTNNKAEGLFSVKGEAGEKINISFEGLENNQINLVHQSGAIITARFEGYQQNETTLQHYEFIQMNPVKFILDVPDNVVTGKYESEFKIKARYN